jgi:hypothetical protein
LGFFAFFFFFFFLLPFFLRTGALTGRVRLPDAAAAAGRGRADSGRDDDGRLGSLGMTMVAESKYALALKHKQNVISAEQLVPIYQDIAVLDKAQCLGGFW